MDSKENKAIENKAIENKGIGNKGIDNKSNDDKSMDGKGVNKKAINIKIIMKEVKSWSLVLIIAFLCAFIISSKAYAKVIVHQSSMENTLFAGQHLIVDEISYKFHEPKRGDIITFFANEDKGTIVDDFLRYIDGIAVKFDSRETSLKNEKMVKRVIGIEGDVIDIKDGLVYVNNVELEESYIHDKTETREVEYPLVVGKGKLFVLGDNRAVSEDSRAYGVISCDQVQGKVIFRIYPFNRVGKVK
ncbi:MAG TPA: signal peptidase I [Mobilitalea sp.]|nr:signal peptidase I [Mobilitalea sp.]